MIQLSSLPVRAGAAREAVRPEAKTPKTTGAKARELGSWTSTTGATSGRLQVGVGGSCWMSSGLRPNWRRLAATVSASLLRRPYVRAVSESGCQFCLFDLMKIKRCLDLRRVREALIINVLVLLSTKMGCASSVRGTVRPAGTYSLAC